ncbi:conserved hypothetical protein [Trichinella spiralis]|uniref:hypothetical protein n=1 Tax=Trichinella spiralis TaxID=6334 RepID=UPI0001EFC36E|nr:conserved hypothetical protein [Trichinella spiralis]
MIALLLFLLLTLLSHPEQVKSIELTTRSSEARNGKLLLLNEYSLEKGVIITALRSLFIFGYCTSNIRFECLPLKCSSSGQLEIWFTLYCSKQMQRTRTELMRFFLQKMKTKKTEATADYGSGFFTSVLASCQRCVRGYIVVDPCFRCLIKYILTVCCFIVAMPSGKREIERKGNAPVNTGSSPNSDGRANNLVEEADEPARGSGPLHKT